MMGQLMQALHEIHLNFPVEDIRHELEGEFQVNTAIQIQLPPVGPVDAIATAITKGFHRCHGTGRSNGGGELIAHQDEVHLTMSHDQLVEIVQACRNGVGIIHMEKRNATAAVFHSDHNIVWYALAAELQRVNFHWKNLLMRQTDLVQLARIITAIHNLSFLPSLP